MQYAILLKSRGSASLKSIEFGGEANTFQTPWLIVASFLQHDICPFEAIPISGLLTLFAGFEACPQPHTHVCDTKTRADSKKSIRVWFCSKFARRFFIDVLLYGCW